MTPDERLIVIRDLAVQMLEEPQDHDSVVDAAAKIVQHCNLLIEAEPDPYGLKRDAEEWARVDARLKAEGR